MFNRRKIKFLPLNQRKNKITVQSIYRLDDKVAAYQNADLKILASRVIAARKNGKPVIWAMGAHPIRRGNSRFIIDLMKRGFITHLAVNGACAIHDFEFAAIGATCEDVEFYIKNGRFGNWRETGFYINAAAKDGFKNKRGLGESVAKMLYCGKILSHSLQLPHKEISIFRAAYEFKILITVHKGIGYDITDQHPSADFAALGWTSGRDFLIFADSISKLEGGGVFVSIGTQVMGPEVYLKSLSMARNVASQQQKEIRKFTTAVFDIIDLGNWKDEPDVANYKKPKAMADPRYYFRPLKSILIRTVKDGGESFYIRGDFGTTIPALYRCIVAEQDEIF